jgi:hypothetical protein
MTPSSQAREMLAAEYAANDMSVITDKGAAPYIAKRDAACLRAIEQAIASERAAVVAILKQVLQAIDSGRSEPLFIMRDTVRNYLEDATNDAS